jgi:hypothetical protein
MTYLLNFCTALGAAGLITGGVWLIGQIFKPKEFFSLRRRDDRD